jgi:hypothetical protein
MARLGEWDRKLWELPAGTGEDVEGRLYCSVLVCTRAVRACR